MEDDFQDSKSTTCLDHTQVRLYRAWKRHVTLAMAALAFLAVLAAIEKSAHPAPVLPDDPDQAPPADCGTIALTVPEAQRLFHLFTTLIRDSPPRAARARIALHLAWSDLAPPPPGTRPLAPLPNPPRTHRITAGKITIYDWSTRRRFPRKHNPGVDDLR